MSPEEHSDFLAMLYELAVAWQRNFSSPLELLEGIGAYFLTQDFSAWDPDGWAARIPSVAEAIGPASSLFVMARALRLAHDYGDVLTDVHTLTDARYVFDETGEHIRAGVVSHSLCLEYRSAAGEPKSLYLRFDEDDLETLMQRLARTKSKGQAVRQTFENDRIPDLTPVSDGAGP